MKSRLINLNTVTGILFLLFVSAGCGETSEKETEIESQKDVQTNDKINPSDNEPWRTDQLIEPSELVQTINDPNAKKPIIYSVGPGGDITGSIEMGAAQEKENLDRLRTELSKLERDAEIVVYCGCCPFKDCPNIRPSFKLLNEMEFTNHKLLNLPNNIKVDWIDKGYPMKD